MRFDNLGVELDQPDGPTAYQLSVLNKEVGSGTMVVRSIGGITIIMAAGCEDIMKKLLPDPIPSLKPIEAWQMLLDSTHYRLVGNEIRERMVMGDQILHDQTVAVIK